MRTIPSALITEKNKLASPHPWIILLDVQVSPTPTWVYLTNYDAIYEYFKTYHDDWTGDRTKIIFPHSGGESYEYFPFKLSKTKETSSGKLDSFRIIVDNTNRQMEAYLHANNLVGNQVILRLVNLNYMTSSSNQILDYFKILTITSGGAVTFVLGHAGLINKQFGRTITRSCGFRFGDTYCGFSPGGGEICKRIFGSTSDDDTCVGKVNSTRYGGFPNARGFI